MTTWRGRAYAPRDGVSIGFSRSALESIAEKEGFTCGLVRYFGGKNFSKWLDVQIKELRAGLERLAANEVALRSRRRGGPSS